MADTVPSVLPQDALSRLAGVRSLLDLIDLTGATREDLDGPSRRRYTGTIRPDDLSNLSFDPAAGRFGVQRANGTGSHVADGVEPTSWLAFPDPTIGYELVVETDTTHTDATGPFALTLSLPSAVLTLPQLRGAELDAQGLLVPDPDHVKVRFHLPRLAVHIERRTPTGDPTTSLRSATGDPDLFEFARMEPPHALIGPGTALGFTFRTAVLDLSDASNPGPSKPPPPNAKVLPADWQGLWLPEVRLFVAPHGLEDLAVAAGVEDLWIGIGRHHGVTGTFELDVVNRGTAPNVRVRFHDDGGRWIGTTGTAPNLSATLPEHTLIVVDAAGGLAPLTTSITVAGTVTTGTRAPVTTPAAGTVAIVVTVTDAGGHSATVNVTGTRRTGPQPTIPGEGTHPVESGAASGENAMVVVGSDDAGATLTLADPTGDVSWSWPGQAPIGPSPRVTVPVAAGATVTVTATRTVTAATPRTFSAYFHFDHPSAAEDGATAPKHFRYSASPEHTNAFPAVGPDSDAWSTAQPMAATSGWGELLGLADGAAVTVTGFASFDGDADKATYNVELSRRRAEALESLLQKARSAAGHAALQIAHPLGADGFVTSQASPTVPRPEFWRATAAYAQPSTVTTVSTLTLTRPPDDAPVTPVTPAEVEPERPGFPDWFHRVGLRVRLERGDVVLVELNGEIDLRTAAERGLASNDPQAELPPPTNPNDGISRFVLRLDLDKTASEWKVTAAFTAIDADTDGLWKVERPAGALGIRGVNIYGAFAALGPVLAAVAPDSPAGGEVVPLAIAAGAATGLAVLDLLKTKHVILHGGELVVDHGPLGTDYVLLLDLETAIAFDLGVISVDLDKPITTRYKAIGLKLGDRDGDAFQARPVFDASRGYTLDIPAGAVSAKDPLGEILSVFGVKVSKDNPTYLEAEIGIGAELGIVRIDRARARLRLDQAELPTLTALGATIEVPGAFVGTGYVEINDDGIAGFFDITVIPAGIRASASLKVQRTHTVPGDNASPTVLGVFVGAAVELPAPIPLGNSGLGIYGFAAGIGVNMARFQPTPALEWLKRQPGRDPLHPAGWHAEAGAWAFAAGATLGTVDGGFLLRLKGLLLLELPGPRVVILMKARILTPPLDSPGDTNTDGYPLLAAIEISPDALSIGLLAEYDFASLVKISVPVQAFFDFHDAENWRFDLGRYFDPVVVSIFDLFRGTGYLMVHGKGIGAPPDPPYTPFPDVKAAGITLAVGFHLTFLWGDTDIGLYAKIAGGLDALISIDPLFVGGKIRLEGELRLFIVSIGASAELDARTDGSSYYVHGEICGRVEFFFFDVEGCVEFSLGSDITPPPVAPPLVEGVALVHRSPALVEGSGTDGPIDGVLGKALETGQVGDAPEPVPLDAIPVVNFSVVPALASFTALGHDPTNAELVGDPSVFNPWVSRGAYWWRYELHSVTLTPMPTGGPVPCAWWQRGTNDDPLAGTRLALNSWTPFATPRAMPYGTKLEEWVHEVWGTTCQPAAPATPYLFTFDRQPVGESDTGWELAGLPWPDPADTFRSGTEPVQVEVTERWRCGVTDADRRRNVDPADVVGGAVACSHGDATAPTLSGLAAGSAGPSGTSALGGRDTFAAATALLATGVHPRELVSTLAATSMFTRAGGRFGCQARVLRSPERDHADVAPRGDEADVALVKAAWETTGFSPSDRRDGVVITLEGSSYAVVLYAARRNALHGDLVFRYLAADGSVLGEERADQVSTIGVGGIPARWWDPTGPWRDPVERAAELLAALSGKEQFLLAVATLKPPADTDRVEMALRSEVASTPGFDPFFVAAVEMLPAVEVLRHDFDDRFQKKKLSSLDTVLNQDPDDHALFAPGTSYAVAVTWDAFYVEGTTRPAATATGTKATAAPETQTFTFATASNAPSRLDPWVLDTDPGDREAAAFCDDPVRISFATQDVAKLFAAYGDRLRMVLHGSSGRHPQPDGTSHTGSPPLAFDIEPKVLGATTGLRITSPWEEAVRALAEELPCIPSAGRRDEHVSIQIPFPLDARTDYLVDIVREPTAGGARELVFRHGFTTSAYRSVAEFALSLRAAVVEHRSVVNPGALATLAAQPTGAQLDDAFALAGLDPLGVPRHSAVTVLWDAGATPQPVAVVVDANEALWRRRLAPHRVGLLDPGDPRGARWVQAPFEWLAPRTAGTATVSRVVEAPGAQRAIVLLAANQRGRRLDVDLVRADDTVTGTGAATAPLTSITFAAAAWEDI